MRVVHGDTQKIAELENVKTKESMQLDQRDQPPAISFPPERIIRLLLDLKVSLGHMQGQSLLFRFTIIREKMIVIIREK